MIGLEQVELGLLVGLWRGLVALVAGGGGEERARIEQDLVDTENAEGIVESLLVVRPLEEDRAGTRQYLAWA